MARKRKRPPKNRPPLTNEQWVKIICAALGAVGMALSGITAAFVLAMLGKGG